MGIRHSVSHSQSERPKDSSDGELEQDLAGGDFPLIGPALNRWRHQRQAPVGSKEASLFQQQSEHVQRPDFPSTESAGRRIAVCYADVKTQD